ncbi:aspartate aminotransferase family protein [Natronobacterium gregoryi]|uniref:Acetylornithine aminotransferase n=2 Tax=Natronobacterium gregoryi TaxID=44930 RepID=L0AIC4_NATGS|nr:aspartate aminotransferase family protein [Natronobacterium gregoryi]AFZ72820.1 ornithine/acetylornithine aminotransferase [Natronobacterium gregoryi SP2]ELY69416.1 acetylornithine aminotransferase [Natronobacterium gregoryi SP2]PLK21160.1 aspartate aminotransferase family protein [Natronobacterium gregoryi SP2]SFJ09987.1 acetylornithine/LysW-gamma-L-lysine aminotransferase [Natronobacterium gregoryi]
MSDHDFVSGSKPIAFERGEGSSLYTPDGTEYLDAGASYACTPLGHSHPAVVEAVQEQVGDLTFVDSSFPVQSREDAYAAFVASTPDGLESAWFCNSGTEANEAALKFARSATGESKIVAATRSFHGRTMGSLAATWKDAYKDPYEPLAGDVEFVPYGDDAELAAAVDDETAAVILEPIQGEGGINVPPVGYLEHARELTEEVGAALVLDEVQTGMGRTGEMWACQNAEVTPDVLTTAKGLGNGLPVGGIAVQDWIANGAASHNATFSGGPVVAAAVHATISTLFEAEWPAHAAEMGDSLTSELEAAVGDEVRDIRGEGLLVGLELKRGANRVARDLAMNHQVLALPAGRTVLRLLPPLVIDETETDEIVSALSTVLAPAAAADS